MHALRALVLAASGLVGILPVAPTLAQTVALQDDADPLTPKTAEGLPPRAPGTPVTVVKSGTEPHPAIVIVLRRLGVATPIKSSLGEREDREALAAFYAENGGPPLWTSAAGVTQPAMAAADELAKAQTSVCPVEMSIASHRRRPPLQRPRRRPSKNWPSVSRRSRTPVTPAAAASTRRRSAA